MRDWGEASVRPHALIDVSDGLASEMHHVCETSEVGTQLYEPALPIDPETRNTAAEFGEDMSIYALFGGEDYGLLFTLPEDALDPQTFSVIGDIEALDDPEQPVRLQRANGENVLPQPGGFDYFDEPGGDGQPGAA